jgi:hypothetical protein
MGETLPARSNATRDWWFWVAAFFLLVEAALFLVPHVWRGRAGLVLWMLGGDPILWWAIAGLLCLAAVAWSLLWRPFLNRWRVLGGLLIVLVALGPFAFRVYPSSHEGEVSEVRFRLPLDGPILVGWGGDTPGVNYHVKAPDQRWAYDLLVAKNGKTHAGDGTKFEDYYCYGLPVLAPAEGRVVSVLDGMADTPLHTPQVVLPAGGNQIVIEVAPRQYLFLCHLQRGSILVKEGDQVKQGQKLALVGNSGNTSEPHLHIHLQDTPEPHLGEGIPLYFYNYRSGGKRVERGMPTGGVSLVRGFIGQVVEHAGADNHH